MQKIYLRLKRALLFTLLSVFTGGCAYGPSLPHTYGLKPQNAPSGIYHRVEKGQTLWRISKIYNIDLDDLADINHIADTASLETGRLIFIPNRQKQIYPASKKYPDEDFSWPLKGEVFCAFGQTFNDMLNKGINIRPHSGSSAVIAARSGKVVFCDNNFKNFGRTIIIDHGDGLETVYSGSLELLVKSGDQVAKGNFIARLSPDERNRNRYLHFEIRKKSAAQNPYLYLPR